MNRFVVPSPRAGGRAGGRWRSVICTRPNYPALFTLFRHFFTLRCKAAQVARLWHRLRLIPHEYIIHTIVSCTVLVKVVISELAPKSFWSPGRGRSNNVGAIWEYYHMAKLQRIYLNIIIKHGIFNKVAIHIILRGGYLLRRPDSNTHRPLGSSTCKSSKECGQQPTPLASRGSF